MTTGNLASLLTGLPDDWTIELTVIEDGSPPSGGPLNKVKFDEAHKVLLVQYDFKVETSGDKVVVDDPPR